MTIERRALLSVSDKTGIQDFARALVDRGFRILSTGGTAQAIRDAGLEVTEVAEVTGHPEIMSGRVKTLHPAIHGPLLARRDVPDDLAALERHGYAPIDVVAVNLYPFRETIAGGGVGVHEAMEQVDIGGPTMIRAAAKNHRDVLVVVDPADYGRALEAIDGAGGGEPGRGGADVGGPDGDGPGGEGPSVGGPDVGGPDVGGPDVGGPDVGGLGVDAPGGKGPGAHGSSERGNEESGRVRRELAAKVFRHIAAYDAAVAEYLETGGAAEGEAGEDGAQTSGRAAEGDGTGQAAGEGTELLPAQLERRWLRQQTLRYGENPDQEAAFYRPADAPLRGIAALRQHHGKALSYNNLLDLDGALLSLAPFALSPRPAVAIVKHTTPCGLATGQTVLEAYERALACDPMSAFGSVIAVNREVDEEAAGALSELFVECIVAPSFAAGAFERLSQKKNVRLLTFPAEAKGHEDARLPDALPHAALDAFDAWQSQEESARGAARFLALHAREPDPVVVRGIYGGALVQTPPIPPFFGVDDPMWKVVTEREPTERERGDLAFAWAAVYGVKSNAILLARDGATLGIGAGQMSRVDASRLAVRKAGDAGLDLRGAALASDAFFPFRDGVDAAAEAGARAIIQPGGSVRDEEVIRAADEHDIAMIFTGRRLFRH